MSVIEGLSGGIRAGAEVIKKVPEVAKNVAEVAKELPKRFGRGFAENNMLKTIGRLRQSPDKALEALSKTPTKPDQMPGRQKMEAPMFYLGRSPRDEDEDSRKKRSGSDGGNKKQTNIGLIQVIKG